MDLHDKRIHCADCGTDRSPAAEEEESCQSRGSANEPERCPSCRKAGRTERHGSRGNSYGLPRQTFPVRGAARERDTEVTFAPTNGRLVYYSGYFSKVRLGS
jgi:hypothetical protein